MLEPTEQAVVDKGWPFLLLISVSINGIVGVSASRGAVGLEISNLLA